LSNVVREAAAQLHTIVDFVRWGASRFNEAGLHFGHGCDNAVDEALFLVLHALHLKPGLAPELTQARLTDTEKESILALFQRRIEERLPAPYLTHEAWFGGMSFYVDERVLVPRSPFAELIDRQFSPWVDEEETQTILDLCTGSGCIAIASALAFPWAEVDAVDISTDVLDVARINIERHQLQEKVHPIQSDLFDNLKRKRYDLIVSNPPYVDEEDMASLPPEFRREPELGLTAGEDGLDIVLRILCQAPDYLSRHGVLVVEVGNSEAALVDRFPEVPFVWLDFERGGQGVFLLQAETLKEYRDLFQQACGG
jgi:ribosomal protein L3 glutamine methyltransferase